MTDGDKAVLSFFKFLIIAGLCFGAYCIAAIKYEKIRLEEIKAGNIGNKVETEKHSTHSFEFSKKKD